MNEVIVLLQAEIDIQAIYSRLEEFSTGLGVGFIESLNASLENLRTFPELAPVFDRSVRRLVMRSAQHGIFYSFVGRRIFIHAVMNLRLSRRTIFRKLRGDS